MIDLIIELNGESRVGEWGIQKRRIVVKNENRANRYNPSFFFVISILSIQVREAFPY